MANLPLYTPCLKDDTVNYTFTLAGQSTFIIHVAHLYDEVLTSKQLLFKSKLDGNNKGIEVNVLQDKSGIEIITSDGVTSYTDTFTIDLSEAKIYNTTFAWSGIVGENVFFSNGGTFQEITTTNWLEWTGSASDVLHIGCDNETILLENDITSSEGSSYSNYLYNEGLNSYNDSGVVSATLTTGNWQTLLEYPFYNTQRSYDVWINDTTGDYILFYFTASDVPVKPNGSTLTGYTWVTTITEPTYISKYNGFKVLDPRDGVTLLGYDDITDISEDGYIFYNEEDDLIKGLVIYSEKQTGECYNKAIESMDSMLINALQDSLGEYIYDSNSEYIITQG